MTHPKVYFRTLIKLLFFLLLFYAVQSVNGQCFDKNTTFNIGERVSYYAYYNWGMIWLDAGHVSFDVKQKSYNDRKVIHFDAKGRTYRQYDFFFKVRDHFQAYVDKETLKPLWFERKTYEGGYSVHNMYRYNQKQGKVYTQAINSKEPFEADTFDIDNCTFDVLTSIYSARNIDYDQYEVNEKIPIKMIVDNEIFDLYIRYKGRETIELKTGRVFRTLKFSPLLVEGTIFKGGERMTVWVTDDKNRLPVLIEAKILIGSVKAVLKQTGNLRYPIEAEVTSGEQ